MPPVDALALNDIPALVTKVAGLTPRRQYWFRGQGCDSYKLSPSLWRHLRPKTGATEVEPGQVLEMERRLLTRFRQRSLPYWPAGYPQTDWEHLFAMQHYGVPTRLLDWSTNLLMGVYFALDHEVSTCSCGTGNCKPTIWLLDPVLMNQTNKRLDGVPVGVLATSDEDVAPWSPGVAETRFAPDPVAIHGTYNSDRIAAQSGAFTVGGKTVKPVDDLDLAQGVLCKITLESPRENIKKQLQLLGITKSAVYPGLAEAAYDITQEEIFS
jgi:hypothetical protein